MLCCVQTCIGCYYYINYWLHCKHARSSSGQRFFSHCGVAAPDGIYGALCSMCVALILRIVCPCPSQHRRHFIYIYIYELGVCFAAPISRLRTADGGHVDALCCSALCLFPESLTTVLRNMRWPLNMCRALILRVCRWLTCTPKWVSCVQKSRCQCRRARSGGGH